MRTEKYEGSSVRVNRGCVDSITIYEVTESELCELEAGSPTGYLFDAFIACISAFISIFSTLMVSKVESDRVFCVLVVLIVGTFFGGVVSLLVWLACRKKRKTISMKIRARIQLQSAESFPDPTVKNIR